MGLKRSGFKRKVKSGKPSLRTKQRSKTDADVALWDAMANIVGCVACRKDGIENYHVSIHHIESRTKPGCHQLVLPLCPGHHQDGTGAPGLVAVHPWKARFEEKYGDQYGLLEYCKGLILKDAK